MTTSVATVTERELTTYVRDVARAFGWRRYHTGLSKHSRIPTPVYLVLAGAVAVAVIAIARRSSTSFAIGIALFAGVIAAPHGYPSEYSALLPALPSSLAMDSMRPSVTLCPRP